jgi:DNA-binding transcriptional LysR family regulator
LPLTDHRADPHPLSSGQIYKWEFEKGGRKVLIDVPGGLTLDESSLMRDAALAGAGLTYIGEQAVREDIASGRLVAVLEDWSPPYPGLTLYFASRRYIPARLRALIDLIREMDYR